MSIILGIIIAMAIVFRLQAIYKMVTSYDFIIGIGEIACIIAIFCLFGSDRLKPWNGIKFIGPGIMVGSVFVACSWIYRKIKFKPIKVYQSLYLFMAISIVAECIFFFISETHFTSDTGILADNMQVHFIVVSSLIILMACIFFIGKYLNTENTDKQISPIKHIIPVMACMLLYVIEYDHIVKTTVEYSVYIICFVAILKMINCLPSRRFKLKELKEINDQYVFLFSIMLFVAYFFGGLEILSMCTVVMLLIYYKSIRIPLMVVGNIILLGFVVFKAEQGFSDSSDTAISSSDDIPSDSIINSMPDTSSVADPTSCVYAANQFSDNTMQIPDISQGMSTNTITPSPDSTTTMMMDSNMQATGSVTATPDGATNVTEASGIPVMGILPDGTILNGLNIPDGSISWNGNQGTIFDATGRIAYTIDGNTIFDSAHQPAYTVHGNQIVDSLGQNVLNKA